MSNIFNKTFEILTSQKLKVIDKDIDRPWGGFFVIDEKDSQDFAKIYLDGFPSLNKGRDHPFPLIQSRWGCSLT